MSSPTKFAIVKNDEPARIKLKAFRNKNNGTTDVDIEYDDEFIADLKRSLNKAEISNQELGQYVQELLEKATNGIDGYRIEVETS